MVGYFFLLLCSTLSLSLYIYLKTQSAIHIHSNMFLCICVVFCIILRTILILLFLIEGKRKPRLNVCYFFLISFQIVSFFCSLSLFFRYVSMKIMCVSWCHFLIEFCWYIDYHCFLCLRINMHADRIVWINKTRTHTQILSIRAHASFRTPFAYPNHPFY